MAPRVRTRTNSVPGATGIRPGSSGRTRSDIVERCVDVVGDYGGEHSFDLDRTIYSGLTANSDMNAAGGQYVNWPYSPSSPPINGGLGGQAASYTNRILSQSGPLTPSLYLPLSVFEMREIPKMLKDAGDLYQRLRPNGNWHRAQQSALRQGAANNLAYKFGWEPLIKDIWKTIGFAEYVRKRQKILRGAHSSRGIRRKVTLNEDVASASGNLLIQTDLGLYVNAPYSDSLRVKQWGTAKWVVRDPSLYGKDPGFTEAFKITLGLNPSYIPVMAWKALPWSWMADWFLDMSNALQATHNRVVYKPSAVTYCRTSRSVRTVSPVTLPFGTGTYQFSGGTITAEQKIRRPLSAVTTIGIRMPFLDPYKLSVLSSLAILKGKRR